MTMTIERAESVVALFRHRVTERGDAPAVTVVTDVDRGGIPETVSYRELDARARSIAVWLRDHRSPGERVMPLYPSGTAFVAAFLGVLYADMVAVPAPLPGQYGHQRRRVGGIVRDAGVSVVLTDTANLGDARDWAAAQGLTELDLMDTESGSFGDADAWTPPDVGRQDLAMLQYTSGSTGDPKGVMVSHGNLLRNVAVLGRAMGFTERTRFGGWIPLYHDMGLIGQLLPALFLGSVCVLMTPAEFLRRPVRWLRLITEYGIHYSAAPNFAFERCVHMITDEQASSVNLTGWRYAANGSEPIRAATLLAFAKRFAAVGYRADALAPCYGLAEATVYVSGRAGREPVIARVDPDALEHHVFEPVGPSRQGTELVSCGTPDDYDLLIVDPVTRARLRPGQIGEIWLRGDSVAMGYWRDERSTQERFGAVTADGAVGYLRTGDLGALHDGELYVTGRIKETLIVRGRNLYPQDIEHEIRARHPELRPVVGAVFGVPTPEEEIVVTHEIRGRPGQDTLRELAAAIRLTVAREFGARPAGVMLLRPGSVRRTTSGKIQRETMRELFLTGALRPVHESLDPALELTRDRVAGARQDD